MKTRNKALLLSLCAVLLVAVSVLGTMAYLTSTTGTVKNTFTVGKVEITLTEAPVNENGQKTAGTRGNANKYHLLPGGSYDKDPTVFVSKDSEDCYVFVKVVNGIAAIEAEGDGTVASQMQTKGWVALKGVENVYYYNEIAHAEEELALFKTITIDASVTNEEIAEYEGKTIVVEAYAVQKAGFESAEDAWVKAPLASWQ